MPTPTCPKCRRMISSDDINVAKDVAYCRECNISYPLSELTSGGGEEVDIDLHNPPKGAWYRSDGAGTVIGATNRSVGAAFGLLFFALFWNGIVSVFVSFAIASTLHLLHVPLPTWFPVPDSKGGDMGVGMTIFLWLFLTPFILVGIAVAIGCLMGLFGRTEVWIDHSRGVIFSGIKSIGWKRQFDASQVRSVQISQTRNNQGRDTFAIQIELQNGKQMKLGSMLTNERRQFILGALRKTLLKY